MFRVINHHTVAYHKPTSAGDCDYAFEMKSSSSKKRKNSVAFLLPLPQADTGSLQSRWKESVSGAATAIVPPEIATSSITLSPTSVVRGGTVAGTITIASSAPSWGTLVQLGTEEATTATVPPGVVVQATGTTTTFTVSTKVFSGAARNVKINCGIGRICTFCHSNREVSEKVYNNARLLVIPALISKKTSKLQKPPSDGFAPPSPYLRGSASDICTSVLFTNDIGCTHGVRPEISV